jgi:hypothetical protein
MSEVSSREFRPDLEREFQYLLGQMPRVDRETFQGLLIENAEVSERVLEAENELFDAWVRGDLPRNWRPMFTERLLATPEGQRKAAAARLLLAASTASRVSPIAAGGRTAAGSGAAMTNWLRRIAALFCFVSAIGLWIWWQGREDGGGARDGAAGKQTSQIAQVETLRLQTVTRGSANRPKFRIPASATAVRFAITESAQAPAELSSLEGKTIWKGIANESIPASLLPPGLYLLTTFEGAPGGTPANYYEFEIAGQQ